jgi:hypothetical protein
VRRKSIINWKYLGIALIAEWAIIGATGFAGYQFAYHYTNEELPTARVAALGDFVPSLTTGDNTSFVMALVATIMLCFVEMIRVPMALASRTNHSLMIRIFCYIGIICCIGVTTKSVSQVMEQMFHTRLRVVQEATTRLHEAQAKIASAELGATTAKDPSNANAGMISELNKQIDEVTKSLALYGTPPKPVRSCIKIKKSGKLSCSTTTPKWSGASAQQTRDDLITKRDELMATGTALSSKVATATEGLLAVQADLTAAEDVRKRAVMDSQLHSFTAMWYGKDPADVTDAELHWFLRLFIFWPAVLISMSATILALASVTVVTRKKIVPLKKGPVDLGTIQIVDTLKTAAKMAVDEHIRNSTLKAA